MKITRPLFICAAAAAIGVLEGCEVGPNYKTPATTMPSAFLSAPPTTQPAVAVDVTQWWKSLNDPELDSLVTRAIAANPDLQIAVARLQQAREMEFIANGFALPELEASGAAARGSGTNSTKGRVAGPLNAGTKTTGLSEITEVGGIDAAWNLDLFGGLRREIEAAKYDTQAAAEARNDVLVNLISEVATAYVDDRSMQLRLAVITNDISAEQQSYKLVQAGFDLGFTNELDPVLAKRELAEVQAQLAPIQAAVQQDQRRLAVLLGKFPEELNAELVPPGPLPELPSRIEPGLPVQLLRRRPDIRQAERELAAATARIGVATDALYPHVILTGGLGMQGQGLGRTPVENSFIGSIGPEAYWPLLDFGTLDALVQRQDYATREALLNYQAMVLSAVEEVDNAISNYTAQESQFSSLTDAMTAAQRAVQVASGRYSGGFTPFLDELDAQRELYALQDQYYSAQEGAVLQFINLYKALGGGWENYQKIPDARQPQPAILATFRGSTQPS
jgi:NodT family efflux transporter outer membrane factor (OMF) lipoprotein